MCSLFIASCVTSFVLSLCFVLVFDHFVSICVFAFESVLFDCVFCWRSFDFCFALVVVLCSVTLVCAVSCFLSARVCFRCFALFIWHPSQCCLVIITFGAASLSYPLSTTWRMWDSKIGLWVFLPAFTVPNALMARKNQQWSLSSFKVPAIVAEPSQELRDPRKHAKNRGSETHSEHIPESTDAARNLCGLRPE